MSEEKVPTQSSWSGIIQSVQSPIGFFSLAVLVVNSILGILAFRADQPERIWLIRIIVFILVALIVIVTILAIIRPQALKGINVSSVSVQAEPVKSEVDGKIQEIAKNESVDPEMVDPALIRFIPPIHPAQFKIISFWKENSPTQYFNWPFAPTGEIIFYEIPFLLLPVTDSIGSLAGHAVIDLQPGAYNEPNSRKLTMSVAGSKGVHFLISAGHGYREYQHIQFLYKRIGYLRFQFDDGSEQRTDLILGKHLREWAFGNSPDLVTEIDLSWSKPAWLSHNSVKRFDLLSVPITNPPKHLSSVEIISEFEESHPDKPYKTPSIIISAITVERKIS